MYKIDEIKMLRLGQRDENLAREIQMDASDWLELYPGASIAILFRRPGESTITPMITTLIGTTLTWQINDFEVGRTGVGNAEIRAVDTAGLRRKSRIIPCSIEDTLLGDDETVLYTQDQVDETLAHIGEAAQSALAAKASEDAAALSAENASGSADAAQAAQDAAESARDAAQAAQTAAEAAQAAAESSQGGAAADAQAAEEARIAAQAAQASAQGSAAGASASRTAAEAAQAAAETAQHSAETAAGNAQASAGAASGSASAAAQNASDAAASAASIGEAEQRAAASAQAAAQSATQAAGSATSASGSASAASGSASQAAGSATQAAGSATSASQSATAAQAILDSIPEDYTELSEDVTDLKSAVETQQEYIEALAIEDTASGAVASFPDGANGIPLKSCVVSIDPVQDLHGYDNPWPAGGGKNLLDSQVRTIGYIRGTDGAFMPNVESWMCSTVYSAILPNTDYVLYKYGTTSSSVAGYALYDENKNYIDGSAYGSERTIRITTPQNARYIRASWNANATTPVALKLASETDVTFVPYENVCPISGWTGVTVQKCGKNLLIGDAVIPYVKAYIPSVAYNTTEKWFQFPASTDVAAPGGFFPYIQFKENTQYTLMLNMSKSKGLGTNIRVRYADGTFTTVPNVESEGVRQTVVFVTEAGKTVDAIIKANSSYTTRIYYAESGIFEGALTVDDFVPYTGTSLPISWESEAGTVYGGSLDVTTGVLTVDKLFWEIGPNDITKVTVASTGLYVANAPKPGNVPSYTIILSNQYKTSDNANVDFSIRSVNSIYIYDSRFTDLETAKALIGSTPIQCLASLATPITYQLYPHEILSLLGQNHVWADTGDTSVIYRADPKMYIQRLTGEAEDDMVANANIPSGKYFSVGNKLFLSTSAIAAGETITPGTNCTSTDLATALNAILAQ